MSTLKSFSFFLSLIGFVLLLASDSAFSQMTYNQYNTYVSNSEVLKLKKEGIDLTQRRFDDVKFRENVRTFLDLRTEYNRKKAGTAAITAAAAYTLLSGLGALIINKELSMEDDPLTSEVAPNSSISGVFNTAVGVTLSFFTVRHFIKAKKVKSRRDQQLELLKKQYQGF